MNSCRLLLILTASLGCLYGADEADTVVLTLPGAPAPQAAPAPPAPEAAPTPPAPKPELPEAFKSDSSAYLQQVIGIWKKRDAEAMLGEPARTRPAYDENKKSNGQILAWPDPTGRYHELELDFESDTGTLRTVFAYPNQMTWDDCRKIWGANVNTTRTRNGRVFYSYLNRKLDVLVDRGGKVISLGLY
ncbi:MAG TPA: hypothetical protein VKT49_16375 [Bryobacteraceae bacterium]|nr:hypothetical protein [Bryobacteraceae bacterium]